MAKARFGLERALASPKHENQHDSSEQDDSVRYSKLTKALSVAAAVLTAGAATGIASVYVNEQRQERVVEAAKSFEFELAAIHKYVIGGFGDPDAAGTIGQLHGEGWIHPGDNVIPIHYCADVARQEACSNEGAERAVNASREAINRGETVVIVGHSLGADAAARAGERIAMEHGGQLPPNVIVVSYGGPASSTGFWNSLPGNIGGPWAALAGVNMDARLPAGSHEHSSQNDIWGNGANQYLVGNLWQAVATGASPAHAVHDRNPEMVWQDEYGVIHFRYDVGVHPLVQTAAANGMYVNDHWNNAANAAFPINNGRDGLPEVDGQRVVDEMARALDVQLGTGQLFYILSRFVPGVLVDFGLEVVNKGPNAFGEALKNVQNAILNPQEAFQSNVNSVQANLNEVAQVPNTVLNPESTVMVDMNALSQPDMPEVEVPDSPTVETQVNEVVEAVETVLDDVTPDVEAPVVEPAVEEVVEAVAPIVSEAPAEVSVVAPVEEVVEDVVEEVTAVVEEVVDTLPAVDLPPVPAVETPAPAPVAELPPVAPAPAPAPAPVPVVELPPAPAPIVEVLPPLPELPPLPIDVPAPAPAV